ncbi:MAG: CopD family protein [Rhodoferax sp.]
MLYATLKTVHLLGLIVWIGGMVFAHFFLRPALGLLEPAPRLRLMHATLGRFFAAVLVAATAVVLSGGWMIGRTAAQVRAGGGHFALPPEWLLMAALGTLMWVIFWVIRFVLYPRLSRAVLALDWPAGAAALAAIRGAVTLNLGLGFLTVLIAVLGPAL